jgi:hypothetical protein
MDSNVSSDSKPALKIVRSGEGHPGLSDAFFKEFIQREYLAGSFDQAFSRRQMLYEEDLTVKGVEAKDIDEKNRVVGEAIQNLLARHNAVLRLTQLDRNVLEKIKDFSAAIARNINLIELMKTSRDPELPNRNIDRYVNDLSGLLRKTSEGVVDLERVVTDLRKEGIEIRNLDVGRLVVQDINRLRIIPRVLLLKNERDPIKPFLVLVDNADNCQAELSAILSVFDR